MALPRVTAIAAERARRPVACALLLLVFVVTRAAPALAESSDEAYSATVKVDATAETAAAAREQARIDGQRRALAAVIEHLSGSPVDSKLPKLDDKAITDMVDSFEVANERMSAVRYVADYTFHFRPAKVRRLARATESTSTDGASKSAAAGANRPVIVLPVYRDGASLALWDEPNPWREAWAQRPAGSAPARLTVPLGDAGDLAAIDAEKAVSGQPQALAAIAQRNGGAEAVVALATARRPDDQLAGIDISLSRYRLGRLIDRQEKSLDANPGEGEADFLRRAADAVAGDIERTSNTTGPISGQQASLSAIVPITGLGEWVQVRDRLASVTSIRQVDLLSLSRREARIELKYVGSQDQLRSSLAEVDLDLGGGGPVWRIQPSSAAMPQ